MSMVKVTHFDSGTESVELSEDSARLVMSLAIKLALLDERIEAQS